MSVFDPTRPHPDPETARRLEQQYPMNPGESEGEYRTRLEHAVQREQAFEGAATAVAFTGVVAVGAARTVVDYFRDLFRTMFSRGASTDAMVRMDESLAVADLLMLAILADGRVTETELAALREHHARGGLDGDAAVALTQFAQSIPSLATDPAEFDRRARGAASRLQPATRRSVYRAIVSLTREGSGLAVASHDRAGAMVDREALADRFAEILGTSVDERR